MQINQLLESLRVEELEDMVIVYDLEAHCQRLLNSIEALSLRGANATCQSSLHNFILFIQNQIKNKAQYQFNKPVGFSKLPSLPGVLDCFANARNDTRIYKLRLLYSKDSSFTMEIEPYTRDLTKAWQVKILLPKEFQIDSKDPQWKHKFYPRPAIPQFPNCDEIIWTNENSHLCEASFTNIFFQDQAGTWHTPHLDCGILPGTMRAKLIQKLDAREGFYTENDLETKIVLVNSIFIKEVSLYRQA
ncbi:MAG: aminotransferase class IV [Cyanobacteria bacterium]|nr:aminotransferase class IV [Cyanobacteriota bacterium]